MNRRTFFSLAGAVAASPAPAFGTDMQKQIKIAGMETDVWESERDRGALQIPRFAQNDK
jgi:hypothetical protein